jgi:hypothetical protein
MLPEIERFVNWLRRGNASADSLRADRAVTPAVRA